MGSAMTVLGPVNASRLGIASVHEHLLIDYAGPGFTVPDDPTERGLSEAPVSMEMLWWLREHWGSSRDDLTLLDEALAIEEAGHFSAAGGETIVDLTSRGLTRDPLALKRIALATGLNIVMGSGYYREAYQGAEAIGLSATAIATEIEQDITVGVDDTGIRSGIIGEIGLSWPIGSLERQVLIGAARAQRLTGAAMVVHPGRNDHAPRGRSATTALLDIVRVVEREGADPTRLVLAHTERRLYDDEAIRQVAETGCFLSFDLFGEQTSFDPLAPVFPFPSDAERLVWIRRLADGGHLDQILMGQDICQKHRLRAYGGHGLDHLLRTVRPQMLALGFGAREVRQLLVGNPGRMLAFI